MSGRSHWLLQRVTALWIMGYFFYLSFYLSNHISLLTFAQWSTFMHKLPMQVGTLITIMALCLHASLGCWTIATDYIKCSSIRILLITFYQIVFLICIVSTYVILWRVC